MRSKWIWEGGPPDLSVLVTSDLQPRLPRLRHFEFPTVNVSQLSEQTIQTLVESSVTFLTAYSAQLYSLEVVIYRRSTCTELLELVLTCQQLHQLDVRAQGPSRRRDMTGAAVYADDLDVGLEVDVVQLSPALAALPPLKDLMYVYFGDLTLTMEAMAQLLTQCPLVTEVAVRYPLSGNSRPGEAAIRLPEYREVAVVYLE